MKSINIKLDTIDKVKEFVNKINTFDDLVSARYVIDAKSIMGIFSLDISAPLRLDIHDDAEYEAVKSSMADFEI